LLPAIERYDGVNFRVLRKAKREGYWPENLDVLILSAKYGLLEPDAPIEDYDVRMTPERARAMQLEVSATLDFYLAQIVYCEVFVNLGRNYLLALAQSKEMSRLTVGLHYATGDIGEKMSQMKRWLYRIHLRSDACA